MAFSALQQSRYRPVSPIRPQTPTVPGAAPLQPKPQAPQQPVKPAPTMAPAAPKPPVPQAPAAPMAPAPVAPQPATPTAFNRTALGDVVNRAGGDFEKASWDDIDAAAKTGGATGYTRDALASLVRGKGGWQNTDWGDIDKAMMGAATAPAGMAPAPQNGNVIAPPDYVPTDPNSPNGGGFAPVPQPQPPQAPPGPTTTTMTPTPRPPISEGPGFAPIDTGAPDFDNNVRSSFFGPGSDPRVMGAQGRTDQAASDVAGMSDYGTLADYRGARYRSLLPSGQVGFRGVDTDAQYRALDPNVEYERRDTNVAGGPDVDPNASDRYLSEQDAAVAGLGGPSRTELAKKALTDFDAVSDEQRFKEERALGQNIAKFGRTGLQANADNFGDITRRISADRARYANELARSVSEGDISDRFLRVDATSGLRRGESGIESGLRGEARTERGYDTALDENNMDRGTAERDSLVAARERNMARATNERDTQSGIERENISRRVGERDTALGVEEGNAGRSLESALAAESLAGRDATNMQADRFNRLDAMSGVEGQAFGEGQDNRNEMRTERGYQQGAAQQSLDNRIRERGIAEQEKTNRITRALALMQAGGQVPNLDQLVGA